jgi:NAD(P)-dependent dehydrogenase (short-subunit alcohol dehydrogenase family)
MARSSSPRYRSLIFVSSVNAELVSVNRGEYCMSKSALSMMARLFAVRMAEHGVGAFEVRPGIIRTAMTAGVAEQYSEDIEGGLVPAGRWGTPQDIGAVVVPLARGQFAFATGSAIHADGGLSIKRL